MARTVRSSDLHAGHLGAIRLTDLTSRHIATMFREMEQATNRRGVPYSLSGLQAIRATLRSALSAAIREDLIAANPASRVELAGPRRPHPVVWRAPRVAAWRATGARPPVAVWTAAQLAAFLRSTQAHPLYSLWWLIALRGLRRGEAVGLPWANVDLDRGELTITQQITADDPDGIVSQPKSGASNRLVALDKHTVQVLRDHARRQRAAALAAGPGWLDTGYVFTRADGRPLRPDSVTHTFARLIDLADLPPVRLHDLRHGAASLAHAAGADLKTIQDQLGHASIILTADTYTTVLAAAQRQAAAATARLVLTTARLTSERLRHQHKRRNPGNSQATDQDGKSAGTRPTKPPRPAETPTGRRGNKAKSGQHRGNNRRHRTHR